MATENSIDDVKRFYHYREAEFFPDGISNIDDKKSFGSYNAALDYIGYYPGFEIDSTEPHVLQAKLAAATTVALNMYDGVPARPDLARAISDRNYPAGHKLAVPQNALGRMVRPGRERALSERAVVRSSEAYEGGGAAALARDVARLAMILQHSDVAVDLARTQKELSDLIDATGLRGVRRVFADTLVGRKRKSFEGHSVHLDRVDGTIEGTIGVINRLGEQSLGDRTLDQVREFGDRVMNLCELRIATYFCQGADKDNSMIVFDGMHADHLRGLKVVLPERESVTAPKLTEEELEEIRARVQADARQRRDEVELARAQQVQADAERVAGIDAENGPILERITAIADEYNKLVGIVYGYNKKLLRETGTFGQDSVVGRMLKSFPDLSKDALESAARLYVGLAVNAEAITSYDELMELVGKVAEQKALYDATCSELLPGGTKHELPSLDYDLIKDVLWLDTNFETMYVECIADCDRHIVAVGDAAVERVIALLGRGGETNAEDAVAEQLVPEVLEEEVQSEPEVEMVHSFVEAPTLAEVRALAETVDWTIMPSEEVTVDDLKEIIKGAQDIIRRRGENIPVDELLLNERLQMIVDWREMYGAQLYYSSDKMMDESGNFYFVLTFEQGGAQYAIAENPVYGNATYVMAEHLMPLLEGESLLTVVRELRRKSIRSLSGRQLIHRTGPVSHADKVDRAIREFSTQTL